MAISPYSPITGIAQTGLTSPTYTITADSPPAPNAKQWAVTALGGTQTGVSPHSVGSPFTLSVFRPLVFKMLEGINNATGILRGTVPVNNYKVITRKGVIPLAGNASKTMVITTDLGVPAGSDTADVNSVRAAISAHIGLLWQVSAGLGETATNGIL